jgi:hypothetical protein
MFCYLSIIIIIIIIHDLLVIEADYHTPIQLLRLTRLHLGTTHMAPAPRHPPRARHACR